MRTTQRGQFTAGIEMSPINPGPARRGRETSIGTNNIQKIASLLSDPVLISLFPPPSWEDNYTDDVILAVVRWQPGISVCTMIHKLLHEAKGGFSHESSREQRRRERLFERSLGLGVRYQPRGWSSGLMPGVCKQRICKRIRNGRALRKRLYLLVKVALG